MKMHYVLTSLVDDQTQKVKYFMCLAWNDQVGAYVMRKTEEEGRGMGQESPWPLVHPPYRYAIGEQIIQMLVKKFKDSILMIDPTATFEEGVSEEIYAKIPWWPAIRAGTS